MGTRRVPMGEEEMAFEEWVQRLLGEPLEAGEQLIRYPLSTELHYQLVVVHARLDDPQATSGRSARPAPRCAFARHGIATHRARRDDVGCDLLLLRGLRVHGGEKK